MRDARIGFACTTIFHYIHFRHIAAQFGNEAVFVIATPRHTNERYERMAGYFRQNNIAYCNADDVFSGKVRLRAVVAPYYLPLFSFIDPAIPRIRVLYGYAKDAWNYANWNKGFDLILAYGPYSQRKLEKMAPTVSIGHPRYRGEHSGLGEVHDLDGRPLSSWLAEDRRTTLLYCPTWGDLSSFNWFKEAIHALTPQHKIIVKLHHLIVLGRDYNFRELAGDDVFLCDETVDLFELFPVTDLAISDYSGAIFDAMLANRRLVLVNSLDEEVADTGLLNIRKMGNVAGVKLENINQGGSLDIQMRALLPNVNSPQQLAEAVKDLLQQPVTDYREINRGLYAHLDGGAPKRAHEAILELLKRGSVTFREQIAGEISFNKDAFVQFVDQHSADPFVVWGAGDYGQLMVSWLIHNGMKVAAILDASPDKQGKPLHHMVIASPEKYRFRGNERVLISFYYKDDIDLKDRMLSGGLTDESRWLVPFQE